MKTKQILHLLVLLFTFNGFGQMQNTLSKEDKIYGLSKFWQEVNYNFVYLNRIDKKQWDEKYRQLLLTIGETPTDYAYFKELQKFCAFLKDGHTNVMLPKTLEEMTTMFGDYRLFLSNIDGKAIVARTNLSKKDEIPVGTEIIEVNGLPTQKYIQVYVAPYLSASTQFTLEDEGVYFLLRGLEGDSFQVKMKKPDGTVLELKLTHAKTNEKEVYPEFENRGDLLQFKWMENDIAYIVLNSFADEKINTLFEEKLSELRKAKGLVIDLRYNGGGSTSVGFDILKYLTKDKMLYGSKYSTRLHMPAFKAWGKFVKEKDTINNEWNRKSLLSYQDNYFHYFDYKPSKVKIKVKPIIIPTAILIGHNTFSAAEDFLIYADNQKHMVKIGENSAGSTGQPFLFDLVGGGTARVCTKRDTYPDGREFVGFGVKPDIEVKMTVQDFITKNDPVLIKAVDVIKSKI